MKNGNKIFLILMLFIGFLCAQEESITGGVHEIYTHTEGYNPSHSTVKFWLEAMGSVWDKDHDPNQTTQYQIYSLDFAHAFDIKDPDDDAIPIPYSLFDWGAQHVLSRTTYYEDRTFGYGLYKASFGYDYNTPEFSFYLSYLDCDYTDCYKGKNDIWVKFNVSDNSVKVDWDNGNGWTQITQGELYNIWIEKEKSVRDNIQNTYYFHNFWSNCLNLITNNNHPRLVWGPHPTMSGVTHYRIYRAVTFYGDPPPSPIFFSLLETVNASTFEYTDNDFTLGGTSNTAYWFVKAYNGSESAATNTVNSNVLYFDKKERQQVVTLEQKDVFNLESNFPNPFNAVTQIRYSMPQDMQVELFVYDIQGKQVYGESVYKTQGEHVFSFDASNLPSGIYFYGISASQHSAIKRMLLIK